MLPETPTPYRISCKALEEVEKAYQHYEEVGPQLRHGASVAQDVSRPLWAVRPVAPTGVSAG